MKKIFTKLFLLTTLLMLSSEIWAQAPEYVTCSTAAEGYVTRVNLSNADNCSPDVISFKTTAQADESPFQRASVYGYGVGGYFEDIGLSDIQGAIMCSLEQNYRYNQAREQSYTFNLPEGVSGQNIYGLMIEHGLVQFKDFKITNYYYEWNPSQSVNSAASTYSFEVNYSEYGLPTKASDLSVELTGDNSTAFEVTSEDLGNKVIYTVTYNHNTVGDHYARLKVNYSCTICGNPNPVTGHARALNLHGQTTKVTPTVTAWPTLDAVTYGTNLGTALDLKGGSASVPGTFAIAYKYNAENVPNAGTHTYSVEFRPTESNKYNNVPGGTATLTVNKANQSITWDMGNQSMYVGGQLTLNATASSKLGVTYTSSNTSVVTVSGNTLTAEQAGTVTITASQAGNNNYNAAAENITYTVSVSKATPTVTAWPTLNAVTYGAKLEQALVLVGGTASVEGTFVITDSYNAADVPNAGTHTYNVTFTPSETNKYNNVSGGTATLTVNKAGQAIAWTATPPTEMTVGDTHTLSATALGGTVAFAITGDAVTLADNTLTAVQAGTVTITASQAGNGNYNAAANVTHTITINKATPTVTAWPTLDAVTYGATLEQALVLVGGTASVAGTFAITDSYNAADVPNASTHTYNVTFTPTESNKYNTVPGGTATLTVNKADQVLTWSFADCTLLPGQTLALDATSTCGAVSYELTGSAISVSDNTLTAEAAGTATIKAVDAGNSNYNAVKSSVYTVTVSESGYTRAVTNGNYGTICLPYGSSNYSGADFYEIAYAEIKDGDATGLYLDQIEEGAALLAGKPYIFKATADILIVTYEGAIVDAPEAGEAGLTGTLVDIAAGGVLVGNYIIAQNMFWDASAENYLNANRAYIHKATLLSVPPKSLAPGRRRVSMGETGENAATDVENTQLPMINNQKLIENGQLIIIRDGVKYNAQGVRL